MTRMMYRMRHRTRLVWIAAALALGCGKSDDGETGKPAASSSPTAATRASGAEPYTGPVTGEMLVKFGRQLKLGMPWESSLAKAVAAIGAPKVFRKNYRWAVIEGERCAFLHLKHYRGAVREIISNFVFAADGKVYTDCLELAGRPLPPEDASTPGPPADGSPVNPEQFAERMYKARSKWTGKKVSVIGFHDGYMRRSTSAGTERDLYVNSQKDVSGGQVICELGTREHNEDEWSKGQSIVVTGIATYDLGGFLSECTIVP